MVQSVAIVALNVGYSITGGTFSLGLELFVYGLGFVNIPIPIQFAKDSRKTAEALLWVGRVEKLISRFWRAFQRCKHWVFEYQ